MNDSMYARNLDDLFSLEGRTVLITGGGGELCRAIAAGYLAAEAEVFLLDLDRKKTEEQAVILGGSYPGRVVHLLEGDVLDRKRLEAIRKDILDRTGRIDILVNGAGGNHPEATTDPAGGTTFFDLNEAGFRKTFDLNFMGTVTCCQVFGQAMAEQSAGCVINIASMNALTPLTRIPAYSAAKAAVVNFTRWLAVDMARNVSPVIRVNSIAPGFFHTTQNHFLLYDESDAEELTERGESIIRNTPQARFGEGKDLAGAAVWLASDSASFVTGSVIIVDGGFSSYAGV